MSDLGAGLIGVASAAFVRAFFYVMRSEWPASYELVKTSAQARQRQNLPSFIVLRFGPVVLLAVFAFVTADRLRLSNWWVAAGFLAVEVGSTSLLALVRIRRAEAIARRANVTLYHLAVGAGVIAATLLSIWIATFKATASLIPFPHELPSALWTGVFVVVVSIALRNFVSRPPPSAAASRGDAGEVNLGRVREAASSQDCDRELMEAIVVVESIQRPAWIRSLESLKARVRPEGTYGVAQVRASRPISDVESIEMLCQHFAGYYPTRTENGYLRRGPLEARLEEHNDDDAFVSMVIEKYEGLIGTVLGASEQVAHDGRASIEILDVQRRGSELVVEGSALMKDGRIALVLVEAETETTVEVQVPGDPNSRRRWTARVSVTTESVTAWPWPAPDTQPETDFDESQAATFETKYQ